MIAMGEFVFDMEKLKRRILNVQENKQILIKRRKWRMFSY